MNRNRSTAVFALAALLLLTACSDGTGRTSPSAGPAPPSVLDAFNVGSGVFVRALAIDEAAGSLWVGTSVGVLEVNLSQQSIVNTFTRDDPLASEYVFGIFVDSQGYKWFGTNAGGVSRYRDGDWRVFFPRHGLADYWIYSFAQQRSGPLWIGTWAGANRVDLDTLAFETFVGELVNEWVYGIAVDSSDRVWFGTEGGVSRFDGRQWHHWTHADGLGAANSAGYPVSDNTGLGTRSRHDLSVLMQGQETYNPSYVFGLAIDARDRVWAGTWGGGVSVYENGRWTNYTANDGLAGNIVYSVAIDKDGVRWFGTNHGLSRFDGSGWVTYDTAAGLADNHVYAIATTTQGDVWAGTKNGVARIGYAD